MKLNPEINFIISASRVAERFGEWGFVAQVAG